MEKLNKTYRFPKQSHMVKSEMINWWYSNIEQHNLIFAKKVILHIDHQ